MLAAWVALACVARAAALASTGISAAPPMPTSPEMMVRQCASAVAAARASGIARQRVELQLPLIGATELDDWPGGIAQMAEACEPLARGVLERLDGGDGGAIERTVIDAAEGTSLLYLSSADGASSDAAALVFLTEELATSRTVADFVGGMGERAVILVNPRWPARRDAPAALGAFAPTYALRRVVARSKTVNVLGAHAAEWQCFRELDAPGEFERLPWDAPEREPTYREVERLLGPADMGAQLRDSFSFIRDTLSPPPS